MGLGWVAAQLTTKLTRITIPIALCKLCKHSNIELYIYYVDIQYIIFLRVSEIVGCFAADFNEFYLFSYFNVID